MWFPYYPLCTEHSTTETYDAVYFWPDLMQAFSEVFRVLKCEGTFMI